MVSKFGNCYGVKDLEELEESERTDYQYIGQLKDVILDCFETEKVDKFRFKIVLEMVKIGLIDFEFL
jgi:hypothetical protein